MRQCGGEPISRGPRADGDNRDRCVRRTSDCGAVCCIILFLMAGAAGPHMRAGRNASAVRGHMDCIAWFVGDAFGFVRKLTPCAYCSSAEYSAASASSATPVLNSISLQERILRRDTCAVPSLPPSTAAPEALPKESGTPEGGLRGKPERESAAKATGLVGRLNSAARRGTGRSRRELGGRGGPAREGEGEEEEDGGRAGGSKCPLPCLTT